MAFITFLSATVDQVVMTNWIGKLLLMLADWIQDFGWMVVVFTVLLRLLMSPLDIWQRISMRKQQKAMARLQPKLAKLQKQYANRPDLLRQKQYELQKSEHISILASCLPMIVTMALFFVVFAGFRALITYENQMIIAKLNDIYIANKPLVESGQMTLDELNALLAQSYEVNNFLWIKNVFMSDIGTNVIPDLKAFLSSGIGGIGATLPEGMATSYDVLTGPAAALFNKQSFWDAGRWNGYFVLPILAIGTSFLSTWIMQKMSPQQTAGISAEQQKTQKMTMKIMNYVMPLMLGVFAILYSAAFAIYYVMSNVLSLIMSVIFALVFKHLDKKEEERALKA